MSLEAVIQENTSALRDLISQLQAGKAPAAIKVAETVVKAAKETSKAVAEAEKPKAEKTEASAVEMSIDAVKKATTDLAKAKGRDAAVAVLAQFGAKNANEVKPEAYADFIAAATKAQEA
jgi:hypothetical protein